VLRTHDLPAAAFPGHGGYRAWCAVESGSAQPPTRPHISQAPALRRGRICDLVERRGVLWSQLCSHG
jgi:hypothetical protein